MRKIHYSGCCWALGGVMFATSSAAGVVAQLDIAAIRGDQSRALLGDGLGVIVGIVDGGVNSAHPALSGSMIGAKDFAGAGTTNDDITSAGHGTGIMSLLLGHDTTNGFIGLAPQAK